MRIASFFLLVGIPLADRPPGRVECACPASAAASPVLVATGGRGANGLIVCGYLDGKHGSTIRASEFGVVRCRDGKPVLEFGATETADLQAVGDDLRVTRVSKWPTGPRWTWQYVPIASVVVRASDSAAPAWQPRLKRPVLPATLVRDFLTRYQRAIAAGPGTYAPGEDEVGKLFVAALIGNATARTLFCRMSADARLDGAAAEAYDAAIDDLWRGTHRVRRDAEPEKGWCAEGFQIVGVTHRGGD